MSISNPSRRQMQLFFGAVARDRGSTRLRTRRGRSVGGYRERRCGRLLSVAHAWLSRSSALLRSFCVRRGQFLVHRWEKMLVIRILPNSLRSWVSTCRLCTQTSSRQMRQAVERALDFRARSGCLPESGKMGSPTLGTASHSASSVVFNDSFL